MKKYISLIKKDFKIEYKDPFGLLLFLAIPIIFLLLTSYLSKVSDKDLSIDVDRNLSYKFNNHDSILVDYLGQKIILKLKYRDKSSILTDLQKERIPVAYYENSEKKILYVNTNKSKSEIIYKFFRSHFSNVSKDDFILKKVKTFNFGMLGLVLNMFIIFGSINLAMSSLEDEIKNQNILLLLKSGISYFDILLSKIFFTVLLQMILFFVFYIFCSLSGILKIDRMMFLYIPLIILPAVQIGLFISSLTIKKNITASLTMFLWLPSMFYPLIKDNLSDLVRFILQLNPLVLATDLIEQAFRNDINAQTVMYILISTSIFFVLSLMFIKRTTLKNS